MLIGELPNLEDTKAGKELIEIGEKRGVKLGEERGRVLEIRQALTTLLQAKHAAVPDEILQKIAALDLGKAQQLFLISVRCEDLEAVRKWFAEN